MLSRIALLLILLPPLAAAADAPQPVVIGTPVPQPAMPVDGWLNEGHRKKEAGDLPGALECYDQAVAMDPTDSEAYWFRTCARADTRDYRGAESDCSMMIALQPGNYAGYAKRAEIREQLGWSPLAVEDCEAALALKPGDQALREARAIALMRAERHRDAVIAFNELLATNANAAVCHANRALARVGLGDYYGAISDCDAVFAIEPQQSYAFEIRGLAKYNLGLLKGAHHDYDSLVQVSGPKDFGKAAALLRRALFFQMTGDAHAALGDYETAAALSDPGAEGAILMHRSLLRQQMKLPADQALARKVATWKDEDDLALGRYLLDQASETELWQAVARADPDRSPSYRVEALYFAGMTNLLQGREAHGLELLRQCTVTPSNGYEVRLAAAELKRHGTK